MDVTLTKLENSQVVIFHVGLERTGTTSLQHFLFNHRDQLARRSVFYPTESMRKGERNHIRFALSYLKGLTPDLAAMGLDVPTTAVAAGLAEEIRSSEFSTSVISSEHFSSRFREPQLSALTKDFARFDCKVVIFVRDRIERLLSCYATHVASGGNEDINVYCRYALAEHTLDLRYTEIANLWRDAFGRSAIRIRRYDAQLDTVQTFFAKDGPLPLDLDWNEEGPCSRLALNRSLSAHAVAALRTTNRLSTKWFAGSSLGTAYMRRARPTLVQLLRLTDFMVADRNVSKNFGLDPGVHKNLQEIVAADRVRFYDEYGVYV